MKKIFYLFLLIAFAIIGVLTFRLVKMLLLMVNMTAFSSITIAHIVAFVIGVVPPAIYAIKNDI